jgi:hypothetical protein
LTPTAVYSIGDGGLGGYVVDPGQFSTMVDPIPSPTPTGGFWLSLIRDSNGGDGIGIIPNDFASCDV